MRATYPIGLKILCNGYVTNDHLYNLKSLKFSEFICNAYVIICRFLFEGCLTGKKFLCNGYVTKRLFCNSKELIFSEFLCDAYVITLPNLFDGHLIKEKL